MDDFRKSTQRKASFAATVKAVLWSFFGVRKKSDYEKDAQQLNPVHVVIAGILAVAVFVAVLLLIIRVVVGS